MLHTDDQPQIYAPMPTTQSESQPEDATQEPTEGVSNPPDEQINSDSEPGQPDQQPDQQTQTQPPQQSPQQSPQAAQQQPQQPQPQQPQGPPVPKGVSPDDPNASHPSVQRAGVINTIAQALAGGPRYAVHINPDTGEMERTQVPMSRRDIGMAIALEALGGAAKGLGVAPGPGHMGRAVAAGYDQGVQNQNQIKQQQDTQATQDFARHAQILETNLRMYNNAVQAGRLNQEGGQKYIDSWNDVNDILNNHPEAVAGTAESYKDLEKYHVTMNNAVPYKLVPRPDPNKPGEQAKDARGVPQWDMMYRVVDPNFMSTLPAGVKERAAYWNIGDGFSDSKGNPTNLPPDLRSKLNMSINAQSKVGAMDLFDNTLKDYWKTHKQMIKENAGSGQYDYGRLNSSSIPDQHIQDTVDQESEANGVPVAIGRALALQESGGQQLNSDGTIKLGPANHTGERAVGVTQLLPSTAKAMGVDPNDVTQNIHGGMKYLGQLIQQYNGNIQLALAAYNAGPGNVTDHVPDNGQTKQYVDGIMARAGVQNPQGKQLPLTEATETDLHNAAKKDPLLSKAVLDLQAHRNKTENMSQALASLSAANPAEANKIYALMGGENAVRDADNYNAFALERQKITITQNAELEKSRQERAQKAAENAESYAADAKAIAGDPNDPGSGDMVLLDKLISQRTADRPKVLAMIKQINPNWSMADAEQKVKVWHAFADDTGKGTQQITSFNALMQHIGQGIDINEQYRRTNSPFLNKTWNTIQKEALNNPQLAEYQTALAPIRTEYLKLLQNNNALTESDKEEGKEMFDKADTPARLEATMKTMATTAAIRIKATNSQWNRVFGQGHNVPGLIDTDTVGAISKLTDKNGNNKVADILKDMDTGGTILGSSNGRGVPGKKLSEALGIDYAGPSNPGAGDDIRQQPNTSAAPQYKFTPVGKNPQTGQVIAKDAQGNFIDATTGQPLGK